MNYNQKQSVPICSRWSGYPHYFALALILCDLAALPPCRSATDPETAAYRSSISQEQLRAQARRLIRQTQTLLEEYRSFPALAEDVTHAEQALAKLGQISETDMPAVIQVLKEAAGSGTKDQLLIASVGQKSIQANLRALADQLTLQADSASLQQRIHQLTLRQLKNHHQTTAIADGSVPSWERANTAAITLSEQQSIQKEIGLIFELLQKLAGKEPFGSVLTCARDVCVTEYAAAAVAQLAQRNYPQSAADQQTVADALLAMTEVLQNSESSQEQAEKVAGKVTQLARNQKQLAATTTSASFGQQAIIKREQRELADELTTLIKQAEKLDTAAGTSLKSSLEKMKKIDQDLKQHQFIDQPKNKAELVGTQRDIAQELSSVADQLEKQSGKSETNSAPDPHGAIADAINDIQEAKSQIGLADQMMRGGLSDEARKQLAQAQDTLNQAKSSIAKAGSSVPGTISEDLREAEKQMNGTKSQIGTGSDQERARWGLNDAQKSTERALKGLQDAANRLAANQNGKSPDGQGEGMSGMPAGTADGQGQGSPGKTEAENTDISVDAQSAKNARMALSLLQSEKASPEYREMTQQYIRNLAEEALPGQTP